MKKQISIKIIVGIFVATVFLVIALSFTMFNDKTSSKRSDFPVLEPSPFYMSRKVSVDEQVEFSDIIVDATVSKVHPMEERDLIPPKGSPEALVLEENGLKSYKYNALVIEMVANEYIKGNAGEKFNVSIVAFNLDSAPPFKEGDRFLLTLHEYVDGSYANVTPVSSYFFIADDNKVYPAGNDQPTLKYSGMNLNDVKKDFASVVERTSKVHASKS